MSEATTHTCTCQDSDTTATCNGGITANVALNLACPGEYRIYLCNDCEVMDGDKQGQGACPECPDCPTVDPEPPVPGLPVDPEPVYRNQDHTKRYVRGLFDLQGRLLVSGYTQSPTSSGILERYSSDMQSGEVISFPSLTGTTDINQIEEALYVSGKLQKSSASKAVICQLDTGLNMIRSKVFPSLNLIKVSQRQDILYLMGTISGQRNGVIATLDTALKPLSAKLISTGDDSRKTHFDEIHLQNGAFYTLKYGYGDIARLDAQLNVTAAWKFVTPTTTTFRHMLFTPDGSLWVVSADYLYQLSSELTLLNAYKINPVWTYFNVMNLAFDAEGNLWLSALGTDNGEGAGAPIVIKLASDTSVLAVWKGQEDSFWSYDLVASDDRQTLAFIGNTHGQTPDYGVLFNNHLLETDPAAGGFELLDPAVIEVTPVDTPLEDLLKPIEVSLVDYDLESSDIDIGVTVTDIDMSTQ